ncbi:MAG: prepilin peptidase [Tenericutes bacterium]|nr:prepilin peptidase [Mycoplasmatota bacterium]
MRILYSVGFLILGLLFGSFYNVVGFRLPQKKSIIKPRSSCSKCSHILKWYELIPVMSFIFQKGKCRHCHKSISLFYPFTELMTGILFMVSYYIFGFNPNLLISLFIVSFLIIVIVSDLNYMIIPDEITLLFSILVIIVKFILLDFNTGLFSLLSGVIMFTIMYLIMLIGNLIFKKETLGGGDIKLMFFIGLTLHPILAILTIFIGSIIALPVAIYLQVKKNEKMIPFGPFLLLGNAFIFLTQLDLNTIKLLLTK